ncbi:MAG: SRPBCC domain-containing protein [Deltaproteobacteria bacterium]|nr:SRPBCC domain-containing protein [Deltaproteobacteria bacterium]
MATVRQQINVAVAPRAVWRAFTTAEGLSSWWVDDARVDAREGGRVVVRTEDDEGEQVEERGIFHEYRPARRLAIAWDPGASVALASTRLEITLARDGKETRVVLIQSGVKDELLEESEKTWRQALRGLRDALEAE